MSAMSNAIRLIFSQTQFLFQHGLAVSLQTRVAENQNAFIKFGDRVYAGWSRPVIVERDLSACSHVFLQCAASCLYFNKLPSDSNTPRAAVLSGEAG